MNKNEFITREQAMAIILFKLPKLSDTEIIMVKGFISGIEKGREKENE